MKVLLVTPPSSRIVYKKTNVKVGTPSHPIITFAIIAGGLLKDNHNVRILDLDLYDEVETVLKKELKDFNPDYVGVTGTTPVYLPMLEVLKIVKEYNPDILTVAGGVHVTIFPKETLETGLADIVVIGEGDTTFNEIIASKELEKINGIAFKRGGEIVFNATRDLIKNLDDSPMPAWELYNIGKYKGSRLVEKKSPCGLLETSRGCVYNCVYCNKSIFGAKFRVKSIERVMEEIERMLKLGFKQIHVIDDGFSTNIDRAKKICDEIIKKELRFPWTLFNGVRVDRVDYDLFVKLKKAGCWLVAFGIESGNQEVLDKVNKGITLKQIETAVSMAKKAKINTFGFFMVGLPGESEKSLRETIDFAKKLDLDIVKFDYTIPYPGTVLYNELKKDNYIKGSDWTKYICHGTPREIYDHPDLSWDIIEKYYKKSFREYYLRPEFIFKRMLKSVLNGDIFSDIQYFLQTRW